MHKKRPGLLTRALVVPTLMTDYAMFTSMRRHGARALMGRQQAHVVPRVVENICKRKIPQEVPRRQTEHTRILLLESAPERASCRGRLTQRLSLLPIKPASKETVAVKDDFGPLKVSTGDEDFEPKKQNRFECPLTCLARDCRDGCRCHINWQGTDRRRLVTDCEDLS
jgi:hypothetical protein